MNSKIFRTRAMLLTAAVAALMLCSTGCKKNQATVAAQAAQDPASMNEAPVNSATPQSSVASTPDQGYQEPAAEPDANAQPVDDSNYENYDATDEYATQPPPPIPDYEQPDDPGDGYIWTPGYWAWAPAGYYWVPGAWTYAPYSGALWTPGWWGFVGGRYCWHHGYWGVHIGYYGGVNYGFGYIGHGYYGGYWQGGHFWYNQAYNHVNASSIRNVYVNRDTVNIENNSRVSYVGGHGGLNSRPTPNEFAAMRETHAAPMAAQRQNAQEAQNNRASFYSQNNGHPRVAVAAQPLAADRNIPAPAAARVQFNRPTPQAYKAPAARPQAAQQAHPAAAPAQQARPEQQERTQQPARPEQQTRPASQPHATPQQRSAPQQRPEYQRPAQPEQHAAPQQEHAAPAQQHVEQHAAPQQHSAPAPQNHPAPQQHAAPQSHPAPQHAAPQRPAEEKR